MGSSVMACKRYAHSCSEHTYGSYISACLCPASVQDSTADDRLHDRLTAYRPSAVAILP